MRVSRKVAVLMAAVVMACGGGGDDDDDGNPIGPPPAGGATNGSFSAQVNGATWSATGTITVTRQPNDFIGLGASGFAGSNAYAFVIGIGNATGPGTHSFDLSAGGDGSSMIIGSQTAGYGTAFSGGSGSVTITTLTANRIVGTFSGTAVPSSGTGSSLAVTNGRFDVTF
jgi:hypothetical protein